MSATTRFTRLTDVGTEVLFPKPQVLKIIAVDVSLPFIVMEADWGPVNKATEVTSLDELMEIFIAGKEGFYQAWLDFLWFRVPKILIGRVVHYTDITDKTTTTAVKATVNLEDTEGVPSDILTIDARYFGVTGNDITVDAGNFSKIETETTEALVTGATSVKLLNLDGIEPGELINIDDTVNDVWVKVKRVDEVAGSIIFTAPVVLGATIATAAAVTSMNSFLKVYYRGVLVKDYEILSFEPENVIEYVGNVIPLDGNPWINTTVITANLSSVLPERSLAAVTAVPLVGGDNGSTLVAADYIGDPTQKTGIYMLDNYGEGHLPVVITQSEATELSSLANVSAVHKASIAYCEARNIHFFQGDIPFDMTPDDVEAFLNETAKINSEHCAYNYPNLIVDKPDEPGIQYKIHNAPFVVGRYNATDREFNKGPWQASAGEIFGILPGVLGLEKVMWRGEMVTPTEDTDVCQDLRAEKVNPIRYSTAINGFIIDGAFTRAKGRRVNYVHINQIRTLQYVGASVDFSLTNVTFQNHDERLEGRVKTLVLTFIDSQPPEMLLGVSPTDRRIVQCGPENNPRDPNDSSILLQPEDLFVDIFLNLQTPVLRAHFRVQKKIASQ